MEWYLKEEECEWFEPAFEGPCKQCCANCKGMQAEYEDLCEVVKYHE